MGADSFQPAAASAGHRQIEQHATPRRRERRERPDNCAANFNQSAVVVTTGDEHAFQQPLEFHKQFVGDHTILPRRPSVKFPVRPAKIRYPVRENEQTVVD
jgi:hypothetical protein